MTRKRIFLHGKKIYAQKKKSGGQENGSKTEDREIKGSCRRF